ncbi:TFIIB-type zinc ribbon-containing protein [Sulfurospirillum sp.]|uniref:TFIIB-type zinc ribbon-containing protein n=1 Tax=Sulfurospirillum sp. TaxID=2053622 RepID=UPI002FDE8942
MKCPVCGTVDLLMSERSGVEIDYCPQCRGVWLDRGELDKIIERSLPSVAATPVNQNYERAEKSHHKEYSHNKSYEQQGHYKKKESFLGQLFDF